MHSNPFFKAEFDLRLFNSFFRFHSHSRYNLWQETLDNIAGVSMMLRSIMGLPEHVMTEMAAEPEPRKC